MNASVFTMLDLVERLGNRVRAALRSLGSRYGLQPVHLQALMFLRDANRYSNTPQALAEHLGLTKGTVSQSLLLLERKGLIARYADIVDKRVVRLELSAAGIALLKEVRLAPEWTKALRSISLARTRTALPVLRETLQNLQLNSGSRTFGVCQTCRHLQRESERAYRCGLTAERLSTVDIRKVCREHQPKG